MFKTSLSLVSIAALTSSCVFVVSTDSDRDSERSLSASTEQIAPAKSIVVSVNSPDGKIVATLAGKPVACKLENEHDFSLDVAAVDPSTDLIEKIYVSLGHGPDIGTSIPFSIADRHCILQRVVGSWDEVSKPSDLSLLVQ